MKPLIRKVASVFLNFIRQYFFKKIDYYKNVLLLELYHNNIISIKKYQKYILLLFLILFVPI